jgi:hypothetical protein
MTIEDQSVRPLWPYPNITEHDFRTIAGIGIIAQIKARWKYTSEDTTAEWLEAVDHADKSVVLPHSYRFVLTFVGYTTFPGLFELNELGKNCKQTMMEIDMWEKKNAADRRTYERLKAKFENVAKN